VKNKDYREVQFSSTQLVLIFVGILVVGVVIFLLGVSVGKKQAQIVKKSEITAQTEIKEPIEQPKEKVSPPPSPEPKDAISKELASHQKVNEETQKIMPQPSTPKRIIYYIQVGAFDNKEAAFSFAKGFEKKGYSTLVLDPLPADKRPFFRVRIGGFETLQQAEEARSRLKSETKRKVDYFIIKS